MIYIECKPDTILAKTLSHGHDEVKHLHGTSRVCRKFMDESQCRGFVDGHPPASKHPYIRELQKRKSNSIKKYPEHGLVVYEDNERCNRLIFLLPRLEEWIIQAANKAGVQLGRYRLPSQADELHDTLALGDKKTMSHFRMLVQCLRQCSDRVQFLDSLLTISN